MLFKRNLKLLWFILGWTLLNYSQFFCFNLKMRNNKGVRVIDVDFLDVNSVFLHFGHGECQSIDWL